MKKYFIFMAILLVACSASSTEQMEPPPDQVDIPNSPSPGQDDALLIGNLNAAEVDGDRCFWIETAEEKITILWPQSVYGTWDPPLLVDSESEETFEVGETIRLGGGNTSRDELTPEKCHVGDRVWVAGEMEKE